MRQKTKTTNLLSIGRKVRFDNRIYRVERLMGRGGSGEVYKVVAGDRVFALKAFFPFQQMQLFAGSSSAMPRSVKDSLAFQRKEYQFLSRLSHPNIVRVYDVGEVILTESEEKRIPIKGVSNLPVLVTDLVDGLPLKEAIKEFGLSADQVTHVLSRLARALEYLHASCRYMHADIKSSNVLVRTLDQEPILIDFALSKNFNFAEVSATEKTRLLGDWDLFPKNLPTDHGLKTIKETDGTRKELFDLSFPYLDLFQFGKLLVAIRPLCQTIFDERENTYLDELAARLTDWALVTKWGPRDLVPCIARLGPQHFAAFGIPELATPSSAQKTLVIPPGIAVPVTKRIEQIINTRSFRRLVTINQLCLLSLVYPGADYKRWVHVLYAYDLARQLVTHLYASSLFRVLFNKRSAQQLLVTVLLHDINHFPLLHIFQESNIPKLDKLQVVDLFCEGVATGEKQVGAPSIYDLLNDIGIEPPRFKRLILGKHHEQEGSSLEVDQTISSILNSGVDVDKLSYLILDSHFTGVRYGAGIDFPTILKAATLGRIESDNPVHLAFTDGAIQALESVVMTRFWNFRSLYWHHTNRAVMAMILHVVRRLYIEQGRAVRDYLLQTMWRDDIEVVRFPDMQFQTQFGQPSILNGLIENRNRIYKRIYTVRAGLHYGADDALYFACRRLDYQTEVSFRRQVAARLGEFMDEKIPSITEEDVLVDIPRREMDSGGPVYLVTPSGKLSPLVNLSDPVRQITANYEQLTKRVRIFVNPRLARFFGKARRIQIREQLKVMLNEALNKARGKSQVQ